MSEKKSTTSQLLKAFTKNIPESKYTNSFVYKGKKYYRGQKLHFHSNNGEVYPCKITYIDIINARFKITFYPSENTEYINFDEIDYWFKN